jgi:thioredoxin-like negative regulator of GroEL
MKMAIHQWLQKEKLPLNVELVENLQQKKQLLEEEQLQKEKQLLEEKLQKDDDKNVKKLTIVM